MTAITAAASAAAARTADKSPSLATSRQRSRKRPSVTWVRPPVPHHRPRPMEVPARHWPAYSRSCRPPAAVIRSSPERRGPLDLEIWAAGCGLIDYLYAPVDFASPQFRRYASRADGDGGLRAGRLVFAEELERFAG